MKPPRLPAGNGNRNGNRNVTPPILYVTCRDRLPQVKNTYGGKRRAAINRLQYSRRPSIRNLPLVNMFNAYMAYSFVKSELSSAVDYSNIMESARSILKVADSDLSTFETRFQQMSYNVRQIGVDTKFTAVEIASAAKFLAMAGMDIATINASMRPITNLALIGDNDVGAYCRFDNQYHVRVQHQQRQHGNRGGYYHLHHFARQCQCR